MTFKFKLVLYLGHPSQNVCIHSCSCLVRDTRQIKPLNDRCEPRWHIFVQLSLQLSFFLFSETELSLSMRRTTQPPCLGNSSDNKCWVAGARSVEGCVFQFVLLRESYLKQRGGELGVTLTWQCRPQRVCKVGQMSAAFFSSSLSFLISLSTSTRCKPRNVEPMSSGHNCFPRPNSWVFI